MNYELPSPAPEQSSVRGRRQKIVAPARRSLGAGGRLDSLSEKIGKIQNFQSATQNDFVTLEQSILSKAFTNK